MKKIFGLSLIATVALFAASCSSKTYKNINYFQDVQNDTVMNMAVNQGILIQEKDMISIIVSSSNPAASAIYNLPVASYQAGSELNNTNSGYQRLLGYVVDNEGNIEFPKLGKIHVAGMNRWQLCDRIRRELIDNGLLLDPVVTVEFMNFKFSVLGEVVAPGTYTNQGDRINILQALSMARDLTIYGRRDNIRVFREINGKRQVYIVDIRDTDIFNSPAYYLQQNDIVYVTPNAVRAGQSTINENNFRSVSFWMTMGSTLVTITNMIILILTR